MAEAEAGARAAREAVAVHRPKAADHWTNRRYGKLTDAELERRIFTTRFTARETSSINDPAVARRAHQQLRALQDEHRIRNEQLKESQRAAETAERGGRSAYGKNPAAGANTQRAWGHETIAARARAEERLRTLTPRPTTPVQASDRLPEWLAPAGAAASPYLPRPWKEELSARREVLAARFDERGHLLAATPPEWAQELGPVPARPDAAQQWRDTAASIELFRARYNVPETEDTPVPERFRNDEIGQQLHAQAVTVSKRSHALPEHATDQDLTLDALAAVERSKDTHAPESPAQRATDGDRQANAQEPTAITPAQTEKPRLRSRLEKITAERNAARLAAQQEAQPQTEGTAAQKEAAKQQAERTAAQARQKQHDQGREL
ncbi:hypothetical protein [Paenarthrobacter sp. CM16]|uniref:hypothetical protein n=1 Tax=Paenarthrobacter sp. CM16 TaxID=2738447 RepID=UPI001C12DBBD|nr:hypothetical protein [Paenarthrobacter sp. CM16]